MSFLFYLLVLLCKSFFFFAFFRLKYGGHSQEYLQSHVFIFVPVSLKGKKLGMFHSVFLQKKRKERKHKKKKLSAERLGEEKKTF